MKARYGTFCGKCGGAILKGDDMKPRYRRAGFDNGKPVWVRVKGEWVHLPKCPKKKSPPPRVDPQTGEILTS